MWHTHYNVCSVSSHSPQTGRGTTPGQLSLPFLAQSTTRHHKVCTSWTTLCLLHDSPFLSFVLSSRKEGEIFVDAYGRGQLLLQNQCLSLLQMQVSVQPSNFDPVEPYKVYTSSTKHDGLVVKAPV